MKRLLSSAAFFLLTAVIQAGPDDEAAGDTSGFTGTDRGLLANPDGYYRAAVRR